jgi:hypothetical protein
LPRLFLPMKTIADGELHDGGSTSFTLVFLPEMAWRSTCPAGDGSVPLNDIRTALVGGQAA